MKLSTPKSFLYCALVATTAICHAQSVLFIRGADRSAGFAGSSTDAQRTEHLADINNNSTSNNNHGWGQLATTLTNNGFTVSQLTETIEAGAAATGQTQGVAVDFTSINLNSYDVVVFGSNNAVYTNGSINAVENYIRGGGGAIFISDANFGSNWADASNSDQQFLDRFGLIMNQDRGTYALDTSDFTDPAHPIFAGVNSFDGEGVSPISIGSLTTGVNATVLAEAQGQVRRNPGGTSQGSTTAANANDGSLLVATADAGRIIGHFDRNTFFNENGQGSDITKLDNEQYAINLFTYAAAPEPSSVLLFFGAGIMALLNRRRS